MSGVLLLNLDDSALKVISLKRAVRLLYDRKAELVHAKPGRTYRSEKIEIPMPSIIKLLYYVFIKNPPKPKLTKQNVLLRERHTCAYCGYQGKPGAKDMNVDHVIPSSRGGKSTWTNLVASCIPCNSRKRDRTPEEAGMKLRIKPHRPKYIPFVVVERLTAPEEWWKHLFLWNVSIEDRSDANYSTEG